VRTTTAEPTQSGGLVLLCLAAWAIPGAGHLWLGRRKGLVFLVALPLMFAIGIAIQGRLFPFDPSEPLVGLAAIADLGVGLAHFAGAVAERARGEVHEADAEIGYGAGEVRAVTYEYGNAFLIVAGLLNLLVIIDAYDIALGRK